MLNVKKLVLLWLVLVSVAWGQDGVLDMETRRKLTADYDLRYAPIGGPFAPADFSGVNNGQGTGVLTNFSKFYITGGAISGTTINSSVFPSGPGATSNYVMTANGPGFPLTFAPLDLSTVLPLTGGTVNGNLTIITGGFTNYYSDGNTFYQQGGTIPSLDTRLGVAYSFDGSTSAAFQAHLLIDVPSNSGVDYKNCYLINSNLVSVDWANRLLQNTTFDGGIDWQLQRIVSPDATPWTVESNLTVLGTCGVGPSDGSATLDVHGTFAVETLAGVDGFYITSGGLCGIGVTNPLARLDIKSTNTTAGVNRILKLSHQSPATTGNGVFIEFATSTTDTFGARIGGLRTAASGTNALFFSTGAANPTEKMRLSPLGNLLIGTTVDADAGVRLQVSGHATIVSNLTASGVLYPITDGLSNYVLTTYGNGTTDFLPIPAGGGGGNVFTASNNNFTAENVFREAMVVGTNLNPFLDVYGVTNMFAVCSRYVNRSGILIFGSQGKEPALRINNQNNTIFSSMYHSGTDFAIQADNTLLLNPAGQTVFTLTAGACNITVPLKIGSSGTAIKHAPSATALLQFTNALIAGQTEDQTISVSPATNFNAVVKGLPTDLPTDSDFDMFVSAPNVVTVRRKATAVTAVYSNTFRATVLNY